MPRSLTWHRRPAPLALAAALALALTAGALPGLAHAQAGAGAALAGPAVPINIAAQPLAEALNEWARQTRLQLVVQQSLVAGKTAPAVAGDLTPRQALERLLVGSGLVGVAEGGAVVLQVAPPAGAATAPESTLPAVRVTASTEPLPGELPRPYAGGQVARGGRIGLFGNRDYMETPFSQSSYTAELIQNQAAPTVNEVVANDPSVRVLQERYQFENRATVRGFAIGLGGRHFNGLYGLGVFNKRLTALERVEVLKGPSALLNGGLAQPGGSYDYTPKRAADLALTELTATFENDSRLGAHLDVGRRFGVDNQWGVRFNAAYGDGETSLRDQEDRIGEASVALDWRGERTRVAFDVLWFDQRTTGVLFGYGVTPGFGVPRRPSTGTQHQPWSFFESRGLTLAIDVEHDLGSSYTLFAKAGKASSDDSTLLSNPVITSAAGAIRNTPDSSQFYSDAVSAQAGVRARLQTGAVKHLLVLSGDVHRNDRGFIRTTGTAYTDDLYSPRSDINQTYFRSPTTPRIDDRDFRSIALADVLSLLDDRVQATLGVRHQRMRIPTFDAAGAETREYDKSRVTPAVGVLFRATRNLSFYGNYIEALNQGPTPPTTANNATEVFPPIVSEQIEVGAKADFGGLGGSMAVFQIEQPSGFTNPATNVFGVDGVQRNRGLEATVFGEPARGVRLLGGFMLLDAEQTRTAGGANDGKTAVNAAKVNFNLSGEWDTPWLPGLTLTARGTHTGKTYLDAANTLTVPSWWRLDLGARYEIRRGSGKPITMRANLTNATDESYWINSSGSLSLSMPRTLVLSTTIPF